MKKLTLTSETIAAVLSQMLSVVRMNKEHVDRVIVEKDYECVHSDDGDAVMYELMYHNLPVGIITVESQAGHDNVWVATSNNHEGFYWEVDVKSQKVVKKKDVGIYH